MKTEDIIPKIRAVGREANICTTMCGAHAQTFAERRAIALNGLLDDDAKKEQMEHIFYVSIIVNVGG